MPIIKSKSKIKAKKKTLHWHSRSNSKTVGKSGFASNVIHSSKTVAGNSWAAPPGIKPLQVVKELTVDFDLSVKDVAGVLDVTPKTFSRWRGRDNAMSEQQADRMMVLKSIFDLGRKVLGSDASVKKWIREPIFSLDGQTPLNLLKTESGRRRVESVLHQIEYGFF